MLAAALSSTYDIVFLFAGSGLVLYIAARAAVDALTKADDPSPGRLAVGHWIPIAMPALLATAAGRSEVGVGLVFATSVAALAMVLGVLTCIASDPGGARQRAPAWPFVVPAAVLALLAGFSGSLAWWHALMLMFLGTCVMSVWRGRPRDEQPVLATEAHGTRATAAHGFDVLPASSGTAAVSASSSAEAVASSNGTAAAPPAPDAGKRDKSGPYRTIQLLLSIAVAAAGGWLAFRATTVADDRTRIATSGLISTAVVGPLLVLPMLGTGAIAAHHGRLASAIAGIVGVVLLNLCALLPLVVLTHYARQAVLDWDQIRPVLNSAATTEPAEPPYQLRPMPFPLAVWRVDTVLLIVLGLLLIPVSMGRITLRRPEGLALAIIYMVYLVISTALAIRM